MHSQIERILKLRDGCGNALPLGDLSIVTLFMRYAPLTQATGLNAIARYLLTFVLRLDAQRPSSFKLEGQFF